MRADSMDVKTNINHSYSTSAVILPTYGDVVLHRGRSGRSGLVASCDTTDFIMDPDVCFDRCPMPICSHGAVRIRIVVYGPHVRRLRHTLHVGPVFLAATSDTRPPLAESIWLPACCNPCPDATAVAGHRTRVNMS